LAGYVLVVVGIVLLFLGWHGIAHEADVARQLPYLASSSIPGAAAVVAGAVLIGVDRYRRSTDRAEEMVAALYRLFTEVAEAPATPAASSGAGGPLVTEAEQGEPGATELVALGAGTRYHRAGCPLVEGKPDAHAVTPAEIRAQAWQPCPVCEPAPPAG
jgi:hypothetical protein